MALPLIAAIFMAILSTPPEASAQLDDPMTVVTPIPRLARTGFTPGETFQAALVLEIKQGYYINSHSVSDPTLVPTEVEVPEEDPVTWPFVRYPEDLAKAGQTVGGLDGEKYRVRVVIRMVGRLPPDAKVGLLKTTLKVHYQTCTESVCLFPVAKSVEIAIPVVAPGTETKAINEDIFGRPGNGR